MKASPPPEPPPEFPSKWLLPGSPYGARPALTGNQAQEKPFRAACDASEVPGLLARCRHCLGKHMAPPLPRRYSSKVTPGWRAAKIGMAPAAQGGREVFHLPFHPCLHSSTPSLPCLAPYWFCTVIIRLAAGLVPTAFPSPSPNF